MRAGFSESTDNRDVLALIVGVGTKKKAKKEEKENPEAPVEQEEAKADEAAAEAEAAEASEEAVALAAKKEEETAAAAAAAAAVDNSVAKSKAARKAALAAWRDRLTLELKELDEHLAAVKAYTIANGLPPPHEAASSHGKKRSYYDGPGGQSSAFSSVDSVDSPNVATDSLQGLYGFGAEGKAGSPSGRYVGESRGC